jgi:hypothetical protein
VPAHAEVIVTPCSDPHHSLQINQHDARCPTCIDIAVTGRHDHLHADPPYKAGCERCSTEREVRCKCGIYH